MIVSMKELSGNEVVDATGFRSGRLPPHSPQMRNLFPEPSRGRPTRKPRNALPSPLTPALIRSPAEWRPVEIGPSASRISLPGAGANVCNRKASAIIDSKSRAACAVGRYWRDCGTLSMPGTDRIDRCCRPRLSSARGGRRWAIGPSSTTCSSSR